MFAPANLICIETIFKTYLFYYPSQQGLKNYPHSSHG